MKSDRLAKILLGGFVFALLIYIVAFGALQSCRTGRGPWRVVFLTDYAGTPGLLIEQSKLKVSKKVMFADKKLTQTNLVRALVFNDPTQTNAPFGEIVFQDLTFLPGTVTFNFFGHEVELLPRVLIIDKQEYQWDSNPVSVTGAGKFQPRKRK